MISLPQELSSPAQGVRIWRAALDALSETEIAELHSLLDPDERERAARFHFARDRHRFVVARGLLRCLLGEILAAPPSTLRFSYGAHGKPALAHTAPIHFNLSHSGNWAIYAVAPREVGIDLENAERLDQDEESLVRLARRVLTTSELKFWQTIPLLAERRTTFLRAWTRKEACAKATGRGVFETFTRIEVIPVAGDGLTSDLELHDLTAPAGYAAALAVLK